MDSQIILKKQDLTYLEWSLIRHSSGTAGSFMKSYEEIAGRKIYYKLSDYDATRGIVGHESVNEIIVDRLLDILGIEHLHYRLINADIKINSNVLSTFVCASDNYRRPSESKIALDVFFQREKLDGESALSFCQRFGWEEYIYNMLVVDFLILNRDRHGANIEVLKDLKTKKIRLAPLFDHGLSLLFSVKNNEEALRKYDVMADRRVQCFVGSNSALENLKLIPFEKLPVLNSLKETDRESIFMDLDTILPSLLQEKIWEMIWRRYNYYEDFCHKRRLSER